MSKGCFPWARRRRTVGGLEVAAMEPRFVAELEPFLVEPDQGLIPRPRHALDEPSGLADQREDLADAGA